MNAQSLWKALSAVCLLLLPVLGFLRSRHGAASNDVRAILNAVNFAAEKHKFQKRKGGKGIPYINHPIGVCTLLTTIGGVRDLSVLQAALLHDVLEDTATSPEELEAAFGSDVLAIVKEVSDDKDLPKLRRKELQILHAADKSRQAKLVSLGDKTHNLQSFVLDGPPDEWDKTRIQNYCAWSVKVVRGYAGINPSIEALFKEVSQRSITFKGETFPLLPDDIDGAPLL